MGLRGGENLEGIVWRRAALCELGKRIKEGLLAIREKPLHKDSKGCIGFHSMGIRVSILYEKARKESSECSYQYSVDILI